MPVVLLAGAVTALPPGAETSVQVYVSVWLSTQVGPVLSASVPFAVRRTEYAPGVTQGELTPE